MPFLHFIILWKFTRNFQISYYFFLSPQKEEIILIIRSVFFQIFSFWLIRFFIVFHFINSRDGILNYFCLVEIVTKIIILANWSFYNFIFSIWKDVFDQLTATTEMNILSWQLNRIIEMFQLSKLFLLFAKTERGIGWRRKSIDGDRY